MKLKIFKLLMLVSLCVTGFAQASLFKCTDQYGNVTYTNTRGGSGCKVLSDDGNVSTVAGSGKSKHNAGSSTNTVASHPKASSNPTPSNFPSVAPTQQVARDSTRRTILERELATEETKCSQARTVLSAGGDADRVRSAQNDVNLCTRNIEALKREIGRL